MTLLNMRMPMRTPASRRSTAGFTLIESEPHRSFGHDLVGETWALEL